MKEKKSIIISLFIIVCIFSNFFGQYIANKFSLPLYLDSIGTVITAYLLGPACGAIVGSISNLIIGLYNPQAYLYTFVNCSIGIIVGVCTNRKMFKNLFGVLTTSFLVTISSVSISVPLNYILNKGYTGNVWGDGVIQVFTLWDLHPFFCRFMGELYVDFIDKVFIITGLFYIRKLFRYLKMKKLMKSKKKKLHISLSSFIFLGLTVPFFLGIFICSFPVYAQKGNATYDSYVQTIYDRANGLPSGTANTIAQTQDGILWIGTNDGIYRYNSKEFHYPNSLKQIRNVNCIYADEEGRLWIGTNDNGIFLCINEEIVNTLNKTNGLPSDSVQCITESTDGNYYIGTTKNLMLVSLANGMSVTKKFPEITFAKSISSNKQGAIATITDHGTLYLVQGEKILRTETCQNENESFSSCLFDEYDNLYVSTTNNNIYIYNTKGKKFTLERIINTNHIQHINSMTLNENGYILVCADNGVGYLQNNYEFYEVNMGKFNNSIENMIFDYQGNLWFTSSRMGLAKFCKSQFTEIFNKVGIEHQVVNTTTLWQGNMYYGTDNGLYITDKKCTVSKTNTLTDALKDIQIRCLMVDSKGTLWISTFEKGIIHVNKNGNMITYSTKNGLNGTNFHSILELQDGTILVSGNSGLSYIKNEKVVHTIDKTSLPNPKVLCTIELKNGKILAGTDGDGIEVIENGKVIDTLKKSDGLSSEVILRMVHDPVENGLYIVTSNGLCYRTSSGKIRFLDNFPYYNNYDVIVSSEDKLLIPSSAGLFLIKREELLNNEELEYRLFNHEYGLRSILTPNAWNYHDNNGNIYLSTNTGVVHWNINHYKKKYHTYRIKIDEVTVDDTKIKVKRDKPLVIPQGTEKLTIEPEIINFSIENPNISVYLEGYDVSPQTMLSNDFSSITYTNIPTGTYDFVLSIMNENGKVIAERTIPISKEKEIYNNWWFKAYIIIVFSMIFIYIAWMLFRTQLQKTLKIQQQELKLARQKVEMLDAAVLTIAQTVDAKDPYTSQHSTRVSEYSVLIAERLGFNKKQTENLRKTALLHDIGKISVPDRILNKPERLTDEEYQIMKQHVVKGGEILKNFSFVSNIVEGAKYHHERYDGKGYVDGLKGEEIPLNARIIGIADAFDAMTENRVYRKHLTAETVINELKKGRGTQFDPKLVDIFLGLIEDGTITIED